MAVKYKVVPKLKREYPEFVTLGESGYFDGKVQIRRPSWDCGWYWGFGYLERWNARAKDIDFHSHFDDEIFNVPGKHGRQVIQELFGDTFVIKDDAKVWKFLDIMKTIYALKETAEVLERGGSNYAATPGCRDVVMNYDEVRRINCEVIPVLIDKMYELLGV